MRGACRRTRKVGKETADIARRKEGIRNVVEIVYIRSWGLAYYPGLGEDTPNHPFSTPTEPALIPLLGSR